MRAKPIHKVMGTDALRYFLLREVVFGQDGSFSYDALVGRYNSDLANGLGNLASRTLTMIHQYRGGADSEIRRRPAHRRRRHGRNRGRARRLRKFEFSKGLEAIWSLIAAVDKFIVEQAPWKLAKGRGRERSALDERSTPPPKLCASSRRCSRRCFPNRPRRSGRSSDSTRRVDRSPHQGSALGPLAGGPSAGHVSPVFPRADAKIAIEKMRELEAEEYARQQAVLGKTGAQAATRPRTITIDDFVKVDLRVGLVLDAAAVQGVRQAPAPARRYRRARTAQHRGRHRRGLQARSAGRPQSGDRRQSAAAQTARHRIAGHDRGRVAWKAAARSWPASSKTFPVGARLK